MWTQLAGYEREREIDPPYDYPDYVGSRLRHPLRALAPVPHGLNEITGPIMGEGRVGELDHDLTRQHDGDPQGQRIVVQGRVLDGDGKPVRNTLVEIWQANAAGRYRHSVDTHDAPLDPNFTGLGRCVTDDEGGYKFITVKPGCYPWQNHHNAWRPAHIHFSLLGRAFAQRLVTQMYFPDDPLFPFDPIFNSVPDPKVRARMISTYDNDLTVPDWALGFTWDIVLRGREATPLEDAAEHDD
jgi:protocatechuate 3,4-dioxygenase beta subunit